MKLFDVIAPIYGLFFNKQVNFYNKVLDKVSDLININKHKSILDVGCGTGALCQALHDKGLRVTGVDASGGMLKQARNKLGSESINIVEIVAGERLPFEDKSFDIVISSYVAHGLKPNERKSLYKEMKRLAKNMVIVHDYNQNRALLTTIVEWLENGDYFNFIKVAENELKEIFDNVEVVDVDTRAAWYICRL